MRKLLLISIVLILLSSLMIVTAAHANSGPPIPSEDGRGIIFEKHDKVKIINEILDIEFLEQQTAKVTATYNMKNISGESLSVDNMFLYPMANEIAKEVKVLRNGVELDFDIEYFGNSRDNIDLNDDWETILSRNSYNSRPFGDGGGFVEYSFINIDEEFWFAPEDFCFAENFNHNADGYLIPAPYESQGKIITRQAPEFNDYEYTSAPIEDIYDYLEDYYKKKGHYDLLAATLSKYALYNADRNKQAREEFEFLYFNSLNDYTYISSNLDWERLSHTLGDGSGFYEYTLLNVEEGFSFIPNDYYFTDDFQHEKIEGHDNLTPYGSEGKIITRQALELNGYDYDVIEIENIYDYLENSCKTRFGNNIGTAVKNSIIYNIQKNNLEYNSLFFNGLDTRYLENHYYDGYIIGAIEYSVDFAPDEEVQLVVKYDYKLGGNFYKSSQTFRYYLTPAKYWQDFGKIEINLHLNKEYPKLTSSSLEFEKIDKLNYRYIADNLPEKELYIQASYPWFKSVMNNPYIRILSIFMAVVLFIIAIVIIIVVAVIKKNKKIIKPEDQIISKRFQLVPFLIVLLFLLVSPFRAFMYGQDIENRFVMLGRQIENGQYVAALLFSIAAIVFVGIITKKGSGNFLKGLLSVFAILSSICFALLGLIFHNSSIIIDELFTIVSIKKMILFGRLVHLLIAVFLIAFVAAVNRVNRKPPRTWFYVLTILASISIFILFRMDIVCLPIALKSAEYQYANSIREYIIVLQLIGERCYGEYYSLLFDFIVSIISAALPYAFYAYAYPRKKTATIR